MNSGIASVHNLRWISSWRVFPQVFSSSNRELWLWSIPGNETMAIQTSSLHNYSCWKRHYLLLNEFIAVLGFLSMVTILIFHRNCNFHCSTQKLRKYEKRLHKRTPPKVSWKDIPVITFSVGRKLHGVCVCVLLRDSWGWSTLFDYILKFIATWET